MFLLSSQDWLIAKVAILARGSRVDNSVGRVHRAQLTGLVDILKRKRAPNYGGFGYL